MYSYIHFVLKSVLGTSLEAVSIKYLAECHLVIESNATDCWGDMRGLMSKDDKISLFWKEHFKE